MLEEKLTEIGMAVDECLNNFAGVFSADLAADNYDLEVVLQRANDQIIIWFPVESFRELTYEQLKIMLVDNFKAILAKFE